MNGEFVLCAAIKYHDTFVCGYDYGDCYVILYRIEPDIDPKSVIAGFLTSHNRFVSRSEAAVIAKAAGQVTRVTDQLNPKELYFGLKPL